MRHGYQRFSYLSSNVLYSEKYPYLESSLHILIKLDIHKKIPPDLPLAKGGIMPLFGKEGKGRFFNNNDALLIHSLVNKPDQEFALFYIY